LQGNADAAVEQIGIGQSDRELLSQ